MERENVCNMPEVATIEIHESAETGKNYACWISADTGYWINTKPLSKK